MNRTINLIFRSLSVVMLFTFAWTSASLRAQAPDTDFVVEQFEPLPNQGTNILNIGKSDVLPHLKPSFGVFFHYQDDPLQLVRADDTSDVRQHIIEYVLKGEVWGAIGLFDWVDIGFVMPLVLAQKAGELEVAAPDPRHFNSFTTADLRIVPKIRLLNSKDFGGFGLALLAPLSIPTGDTGSYNSEGGVRIEPRLVLDFTTDGGVAIAANLGFQPRATRNMLNFENTNAFKWGLGLEIPLLERHLALIGSLFGTVALGGRGDATRTTPMEALGGLQFRVADAFIGQAGAGAGITNGVGAPDFRVFLSFGYTPTRDEPPAEPGPCSDRDGDGICDEADACPDEPEDFDGFEDHDGCPDPDNDRDGILDVNDKCPNDPEDFDGFQDEDGCPEPDNDGDGILDVHDGAPDATGFGRCRDLPETFNGFEDEDGCPDTKPKAILTDNKIEILETVYFDFDKATIQARSFELLDEVVRILQENQQVNRIRVEGHTDKVGTRAYNIKLSDRRAKAVMAYLVKHGVAKARLSAKGYGFDVPIDTNATQEGRDRNRRVEFKILEIHGKPVTSQEIQVPPR